MIPESRWQPPGHYLNVYMGAAATSDDALPADTNDEGCPGSWYRCEWSWSVQRYKGQHGKNVTKRLVLDALDYLEGEEARASENR